MKHKTDVGSYSVFVVLYGRAQTKYSSKGVFQYNPYTEPLWRSAVNAFGNALMPAENRIAGKLKYQLRSITGNTLQFLQEFKRYQELIRRLVDKVCFEIHTCVDIRI